MAFLQRHNPEMDISAQIATNLTAWMSETPGLDTIKKVSAKSAVGFGTVRRAKNGDGNITVQNLELIARAFHRHAIDLLLAPMVYGAAEAKQPLVAAEPESRGNITAIPAHRYHDKEIFELAELFEAMNDRGKGELMGHAKQIAKAHPKAKANRAS